MNNHHENIIKEKRLIEATRKKYFGLNGKIGTIARFLGQPIIQQSDGGFFFEEETNYENLPEFDESSNCNMLGYHFDGLSRGMHFEIKLMEYDNSITVYYKGYKVYEEIAGELFGYNPFENWEKIIEQLYPIAEEQKEIQKEIIKNEQKEFIESEKKSYLRRLRDTWGI